MVTQRYEHFDRTGSRENRRFKGHQKWFTGSGYGRSALKVVNTIGVNIILRRRGMCNIIVSGESRREVHASKP